MQNSQATKSTSQRSVEAILERRAERIRQRVQVFAPDFVHGDATLDELYDRFGGWAEDVVFVRSVIQGGRCVAVSIARFDDWFLGVEHTNIADVDDIEGWLTERLEGRHSVIELAAGETTLGTDADHWITMQCESSRLHELERSTLSVTRDVLETAQDWTQTAQTDLLSLICLCARLGKNV